MKDQYNPHDAIHEELYSELKDVDYFQDYPQDELDINQFFTLVDPDHDIEVGQEYNIESFNQADTTEVAPESESPRQEVPLDSTSLISSALRTLGLPNVMPKAIKPHEMSQASHKKQTPVLIDKSMVDQAYQTFITTQPQNTGVDVDLSSVPQDLLTRKQQNLISLTDAPPKYI
ncbi:MAG: hypothetical protein A3F12_06395 [Gammaproteobacteria bacterium RIFCSPHIGHO2_12_FULL_38_14]|nr:MAG: hypothetical protein A3F12_06395 [Gammaproteobacteria bacterium RIFCSPHIGHO2_12_FULL_38_14]